MNLYEFPRLTKFTSTEDALLDLAEFRTSDKSLIGQTSEECMLDSFQIINGQSRYTIFSDGVPFECLFLPNHKKKLYVLLSAGG